MSPSGPAACTSPACDATALLITVLQLAQFVPQHVHMARHRSAAGLSPWLLLFSSLYTYLAAVDLLLLHPLPRAGVCAARPFRCFIDVQPHLQMVGSALLSAAMWYWYLRFLPAPSASTTATATATASDTASDTATPTADATPPRGKLAPHSGPLAIFALFVALALAAAALPLPVAQLSAGRAPGAAVAAYARGCGVLSAALNALMWLPQLALTLARGERGALSLGWVLASCAMDVAYSAYLAARGVDWSVWANNVPDGVLTAVLGGVLLWYAWRDAGGRLPGGAGGTGDAHSEDDLALAERAPLLSARTEVAV